MLNRLRRPVFHQEIEVNKVFDSFALGLSNLIFISER